MRSFLDERCISLDRIKENAEAEKTNLEITMKCDFDHEERWRAPECARHYPDEMVCTKTTPVKPVFP